LCLYITNIYTSNKNKHVPNIKIKKKNKNANIFSNMSQTNKNIKKELYSNPLYRISMSSIELFHSNFWAWMFETYQESINYFFKDIAKFDIDKPIIIKREFHKFDIYLEQGDTYYVIENKIKSMPDKGQLASYTNKKIGKKRFAKGIIASILPDTVKIDNWINLDYQQIAQRMHRFIDNNNAIKLPERKLDLLLIESYCKMIEQLTTLLKIEFENEDVYSINTNLKEIGFEVVYKKYIGSLLKKKILDYSAFKPYLSYIPDKRIEHRINRTFLTITIKFKSKLENIDLAIEIEDYEYRWCVIENISHQSNKKNLSKNEKIKLANALHKTSCEKFNQWINKSKILRFVTTEYTFIYQKQQHISAKTMFTTLIDRIIGDIQFAIDLGYLDKISG
jgi:hypothetical protein